MDSHRDPNAPPPYVDPAVPYTAPTLTEKSGAPPPGWANPDVHQPGNPTQGPIYPQLSPGYPPQGPPQGSPKGHPPQSTPYFPQGGVAPTTPQHIDVNVPGQYIVQSFALGPDEIDVDCPKCGKSIKTEIRRLGTAKTHLFAILLCLIGCWPCAWAPYCMGSCTDTAHQCPHCKHFFGVYKSSC